MDVIYIKDVMFCLCVFVCVSVNSKFQNPVDKII